MSPKSSSSTITSTEVRELLETAARQLSSREEKALRMRHGGSLGLRQPLPQRGQDNPEVKAELLALEVELRQKLLARGGSGTSKKAAPKGKAASPKAAAPAASQRAASSQKTATPAASQKKDKIIRALRRLK